MGFSRSERERRAAAKVAQEEKMVNWLSLEPQISVLRLVETERRKEAALTDENMRRIAELDRANAEKRKLRGTAVRVPAVETCDLSVETNIAIDKVNKRRQKARPDGRLHPIVKQEIIPERRMERELNPKPRKPAEDSWRIKLTAGPHWQDAIKWFKMTPAEAAAAEAAIETAMNTVIGAEAQTLVNQAEWDELAASGKLEQMDFFGYVWPTDKE